jgi:hypothetical protein
MMNKLILAMAATLAAAGGVSSANAAVTDPIILSGIPQTDSFGGVVGAGLFDDTFDFTVPISGSANSFVHSIALQAIGLPGDLDFSSVVLDGFYIFDVTNGFLSGALLNPIFLNAGQHSLRVMGSSIGSASYAGTINVTTGPAIPEPASWAMMVAGVAAAGLMMRRRAPAARVAFN